MKLVAENNAIGALDGAFASGATTLTLQSMTGMPVLNNVDEYCVLTLIRASDNAVEYVHCTAQNIPARTYTVTRGQEDSVPLDFVDSDEARNLWTKGQIDFVKNENDISNLPLDGSRAMEADIDLDGNTLANMPDAVNPTEPTSLQQVQNLIADSEETLGTLLTTIDLSTGSPTEHVIEHLPAWDTYDKIKLKIRNCVSNGTGLYGVAILDSTGPNVVTTSYVNTNNLAGSSYLYVPFNVNLIADDHLLDMDIEFISTSYTTFNCTFVGGYANSGGGYTALSNPAITNGTARLGVATTSWTGLNYSIGQPIVPSSMSGKYYYLAHQTGSFTSGTLEVIGIKE